MATRAKRKKKEDIRELKIVASGAEHLQGVFGRFVGWTLKGDAVHEEIVEAGLALGFDEEDMVEARSPQLALQPALTDVFPERKWTHEVIKAKRGATEFGVSIKSRHGTVDEDGVADTDLATEVRVFLRKGAVLEVVPPDHAEVGAIHKAFAHWRSHVDGTRYSNWMIRKLYEQGPVIKVLRGGGGVYYAPNVALAEWDRIVALTQTATSHSINQNQVTMLDEFAVASVLEGITSELTEGLDKMNDQLEAHADGTKVMGSAALSTIKENIEELELKMKFYEDLLGKSLDTYRERTDELEMTASQAMMAVEAEKAKARKEKKTAGRSKRK